LLGGDEYSVIMQERKRWAAHVQEIGILGMCYICKLSGRKELAGYDMESTGGGVMGMLGKFSLQFLTVLRGLGLFNVVYSENGLVLERCDATYLSLWTWEISGAEV